MKAVRFAHEHQKMLLIGLLAMVIFSVYGVCIVRPLGREAHRLSQQIRVSRRHLSALKAATANEGLLAKRYQQLDEEVASMRGVLPPEDQVPEIIDLLSDLAGQTQVKIQTIFPERPAGAVAPWAAGHAPPRVVHREIPIQIVAFAGYHQVGAFLGLVESQAVPLRVAHLHISGNPRELRRHHIKLTIRLHVAAGQAAPAG